MKYIFWFHIIVGTILVFFTAIHAITGSDELAIRAGIAASFVFMLALLISPAVKN